MIKLVILLALLGYGWKVVTGRWPWEPKGGARAQAMSRARALLGVSPSASREEVIVAHRQLVALVHPDRGGSDAQVHEANAARDLLLERLPYQSGV